MIAARFRQSFAVNMPATYDHCRMPEYVLGHHLKGEGKRLVLMSELLDPMHRRYLQSLDAIKSCASTLEVGCGNGSISAWLAEEVAPNGRAVAVDLDLSLVETQLPNLELRKADIVAAPSGPWEFRCRNRSRGPSPCCSRRKDNCQSRCELAARRRNPID